MAPPILGQSTIPVEAMADPQDLTVSDTESFPEEVSIVDEADLAVRDALEADYRIEGFLGQGGMSAVFLARELALSRLVALKVLPLRFAAEGKAAERFRQEATIAASLDHPNVVHVYRIGSTPRCLWYTMKYIRGRSLEEILRDTGPLGLHDCFGLIEQVVAALSYAHRRGVIHRDMKPANVMVDEDGWALVCDFGVAKAAGNPRLTQTGGTLGTPLYMSPEQLYGQKLDGRSDQYSLAILTFELLAGTHPFTADSVGEIVRQHCVEPPPILSEYRPDLPQRVTDALLKAMSKRPEDRFGDAVELLTAMGGRRPRRPVPSHSDMAAITTARTRPMRKSDQQVVPRRRLGHLGIGAVAAAMVFVAQAVWNPNGTVATPVAGNSQPESAIAQPVEVPPAPDPVLTPGRLFVNSEPSGNLYIDGDRYGNTPALDLALAPGQYRVTIRRDGYETFEEIVEIPAGEEVRLTSVVLRRVSQ
jgi:serine/threonine protein kinase